MHTYTHLSQVADGWTNDLPTAARYQLILAVTHPCLTPFGSHPKCCPKLFAPTHVCLFSCPGMALAMAEYVLNSPNRLLSNGQVRS